MVDTFGDFRIDSLDKDVRLDVMRRLAEQAMTDTAFRDVARNDLSAALAQFGYELNEKELELVLAFRSALAAAGIDLFLDERFSPEYRQFIEQMVR